MIVSHPEGTVGGRLLGRLTTEEAPAPMLVGRGHARNLYRRFRDMHRTSTRSSGPKAVR